jgi:DNA-binding MarR family transcriptional regulator
MPKVQTRKTTSWKKALAHREATWGMMGGDMSRVDFDILLYIGAHPRTTLQEINMASLFRNDSLSLIKRAVTRFKDMDLITVTSNVRDGRERLIALRFDLQASLNV